jgi:hypothetical protein
MRILLASNHFFGFTGSELTPKTLVSIFLADGHAVFAWFESTSLLAAVMRRNPGDCSGCEGRCAFLGWNCRQDQFAGWIPVRGPGAGAGRAGLGLVGALFFLCFVSLGRRLFLPRAEHEFNRVALYQ